MYISLNGDLCKTFWASVSIFSHALIISYYGMIVYMECKHEDKRPYVYGYMSSDFIKQNWDPTEHYGGYRKTADMPEYFCPDCLEDLYE